MSGITNLMKGYSTSSDADKEEKDQSHVEDPSAKMEEDLGSDEEEFEGSLGLLQNLKEKSKPETTLEASKDESKSAGDKTSESMEVSKDNKSTGGDEAESKEVVPQEDNSEKMSGVEEEEAQETKANPITTSTLDQLTDPSLSILDSLPRICTTGCDESLKENLTRFLAASQRGETINSHIDGNKEYANPNLLERIIDIYEIDTLGTHFEKERFDPKNIAHDDSEYYEAIIQTQNDIVRQKSTPSATVTQNSTTSTTSNGQKRSRWDTKEGR